MLDRKEVGAQWAAQQQPPCESLSMWGRWVSWLSCLLGIVWSCIWKSARWSNAKGEKWEGSYGKSWIPVREEQKTLVFLVLSCPQWLLSSPITHDLPVIYHSGNKTVPLEPNTASSSERTEIAYCFSKALYPNDLENLGILVKLCTVLRLLGALTGIQRKVHN